MQPVIELLEAGELEPTGQDTHEAGSEELVTVLKVPSGHGEHVIPAGP